MTKNTVICSVFVIWSSLNYCSVNSACSGSECCSDTDYYWKDYHGTIPSDAIPGGTERNGDDTFIGQALHPKQGFIIPGEILRREKRIYYQHYGAQNATKNVKILCTRHPELYQWISTTIDKIGELEKERPLVVGGYEDDQDLFIGRAINEGGKVVGKVNSHFKVPVYRALYAAHLDKEMQFSAFEALTFNPNEVLNNIKDRVVKGYTINIYN